MYIVGLTGGMGSGKSTVSRMLADLGAEVVDADRVAREVVEPGRPALDEIADRFGPDVLLPDGALDRGALAEVVFSDAEALADLEAITHPRIRARIVELVEEARTSHGDGAIVVLDHPLLVETGQHEHVDAVVVVTAPLDTRVRRLADGRGIAPEDARARIRTQAHDDTRSAVADHVIDNSGDLQALRAEVDALWQELATEAGR